MSDAPAHVVDDALIVVSELVGNAVRHALAFDDGCIEVRWRIEADRLVIEVADSGPDLVALKRRDGMTSDEAGRGLFLVTALSQDVVVERHTGRSLTRAVLSLS